jgi:type II secretory ATPase GspE/PulE/Tfp pilus assembly ATPase PilB-like protein
MEISPHSRNVGANAATGVAHADDSPLCRKCRGSRVQGRRAVVEVLCVG